MLRRRVFLPLLILWVLFATAANAQTVIYLTHASCGTWTVPSNWNSANNTIELIGAGGAGGTGSNSTAGGGGGGGAYTKYTNQTLTPSSVLNCQVGLGNSGSDTWLSSASTMIARAASVITGQTGGAGGATTTVGSPTLSYAGGNGSSNVGTSSGAGSNGGGGGGGAAGPLGPGKTGTGTTTSAPSSGGGAADNGSIGTISNGGNNSNGTDGGAGGANAVAGSNATPRLNFGGAGGGGTAGAQNGGNGAIGEEFDSTHGSGGGGGGGGGGAGGNWAFGGNGGQYGGGGGGGGAAAIAGPFAVPGTGGDGLIKITYTPSSTATDFNITGGSATVGQNQTTAVFNMVPNGLVSADTTYVVTDSGAGIGSGGTITCITVPCKTASASAANVQYTYKAAPNAVNGATIRLTAVASGGYTTTQATNGAGNSPDMTVATTYNFMMIGDSITAGNVATSVTAYRSNAGAFGTATDLSNWLHYLQGILPDGPHASFVLTTEGVSGITMAGYQSGYYANVKADAITNGTNIFFIMLGTNDSRHDIQTTDAAYTSAASTLANQILTDFPGARVIFMTPPWYDGSVLNNTNYGPGDQNRIDGSSVANRNYQADLASVANGTTIFYSGPNMFKFFKNAASPCSLFSATDCIHPLDAGHRVIALFMWQAFKSAIIPDKVGGGGGFIIGANESVRRWFAANDDFEEAVIDRKMRRLVSSR